MIRNINELIDNRRLNTNANEIEVLLKYQQLDTIISNLSNFLSELNGLYVEFQRLGKISN